MNNLNLHGKLLSVKGKVARIDRYMAYVTLFSRGYKRNKWQKYHITFFHQVAKDFVEVAQIVRETFSKATITNRRVKLEFKPQYAYIEELVKLAKKGIAEMGMAEFKQNIIYSQGAYIASIKKEPEGSDLNSSICFKWWPLTYRITPLILQSLA